MTSPKLDKLRRQIIATARALNEKGLSRGTSGNVSARVPGGYLITPSGVPYAQLRVRDIGFLKLDAEPGSDHQPRPSSEWRFHRDIYVARPEAAAIVHAHPPFGTTLACLHRGIPSFHYMVAVAGGDDIRCSPYATYGTQALSDHVVEALRGRKATLMGNHGMVAFGADLDRALALAVEVETLAEQYWRALQLGEPVLLDKHEMATVIEKFKSYGAAARRPR